MRQQQSHKRKFTPEQREQILALQGQMQAKDVAEKFHTTEKFIKMFWARTSRRSTPTLDAQTQSGKTMKIVWARRSFNYDGIEYDQGAIVSIKPDARNNPKLFRLGYLEECEKKDLHVFQCASCGLKFIDETFRDWHVQRRHSAQYSIFDEDSAIETIERREQEIAPLYLHQSEASKK